MQNEMESETVDPLRTLRPLMKAKGVRVPAVEFHRAVNLLFHAAESKEYDSFHDAMWQSLPAQIERLVQDVLDNGALPDRRLRVLDIGCGTGLASELLLRSSAGHRISHISMCDTSPEMIELARKRAIGWSVTTELLNCGVEEMPMQQFDLVITSSVLHHIPDLSGFLRCVVALQADGGAFVHLQDPNGDYLGAADHAQRLIRLRRAQLPRRVWRRFLFVFARPERYVAAVNEALMSRGIVSTPLTDAELWSVTDIHCGGLPYSLGKGISIAQMTNALPEYRLIRRRSYGFFGVLESELPRRFRKEEIALRERGVLDGHLVSASWARQVGG